MVGRREKKKCEKQEVRSKKDKHEACHSERSEEAQCQSIDEMSAPGFLGRFAPSE